ncbi:expressed unknown protein [Seminavis robusta]|uniref:Uncharacterized protein n=1 Tax=Seminavis robusta TaxID=568900 RepID=A0A9N8DBE7_9STRA|nr:expressed unknown protein [Seminavis robusta]|eukprot:Sro23_g015700.1 n/a (95) ;mRNA; f:53044-53328
MMTSTTRDEPPWMEAPITLVAQARPVQEDGLPPRHPQEAVSLFQHNPGEAKNDDATAKAHQSSHDDHIVPRSPRTRLQDNHAGNAPEDTFEGDF